MDGPRRGGDLRLARTPRRARRSRDWSGRRCNLDDLIADIVNDVRPRPYELVQVAGGWQMRTKPRHAGAIRALFWAIGARDAGPPELTPTELLTVTAIAYLQPATRAELSRLIGKEVSRDIIGRLKRSTSSPPVPRARTRRALCVCHDAQIPGGVRIGQSARSARHRKLEDAGLLQRAEPEIEIDGALGIQEGDSDRIDEAVVYWNKASDTE